MYCMLTCTAEDGSELAKIHKVKVLRNDRRQGMLYTIHICYTQAFVCDD